MIGFKAPAVINKPQEKSEQAKKEGEIGGVAALVVKRPKEAAKDDSYVNHSRQQAQINTQAQATERKRANEEIRQTIAYNASLRKLGNAEEKKRKELLAEKMENIKKKLQALS